MNQHAIVYKIIRKSLRFFVMMLVVGLTLSQMPILATRATTFVVTKTDDTNDGACDADCSLREAIIAANATPGDDTITLPAGTFSLTISGRGENEAATGDLDITGNLVINGASAATTIIDANDLDRVLHITGMVSVSIFDVTVSNGAEYGDYQGGGILVSADSQLTLTNCVIHDNRTASGDYGSGGGIYNNGILTLVNSVVSSNAGSTGGAGYGGGIYNNGTLALTDSTVQSNEAGFGGGIYNTGMLNLARSTVRGNNATSTVFLLTGCGGGIANDQGTVSLSHSNVITNTAPGSGGGISNRQGALSLTYSTVSSNTAGSAGGSGGGISNSGGTLTINWGTINGNIVTTTTGSGGGGGIAHGDVHTSEGTITGTATLLNSTVSNNRAESGGGINSSGTIDLSNCTISNNYASNTGGGIQSGGKTKLTNCTVSENTADNFAGGINAGIGFSVENTIFAGNSDASGYPDCLMYEPTSLGHNLIGDDTGCDITPAPGDQVGTAGTPIDPRLGPLQDNGGPTFTRALLTGSPAIDAGNPATCPTFDQRRYVRSGTCDIGAYEFNGVPFVPTDFVYLPLVTR
jgi:CSLREA domain-containing protein